MKKGWVLLSIVMAISAVLFLMQSSIQVQAEDKTVDITTTRCTQDRCFLRPGENTFRFDTHTTVDQKKVYFLLPAQRILKRVDTCANEKCAGSANLDCMSGDAIQVLITDPSAPNTVSVDDAGNRLVGQTTLLCDKDAPAFTNPLTPLLVGGVAQGTDGAKPVFKSYESFKIIAEITEELGNVNVSADLSEIGGPKRVEGSCRKIQGIYQCEISSAAPEGYAKGTIKLYATDTAGNILSFEFKDVEVLKTQESASVNAWQVGSIRSSPGTFNKGMIRDFNKIIVVSGRLQAMLDQHTVLKADLNDGCVPMSGNGANIVKQQIASTFDRSSGTFTATISLQPNNVPGEEETYSFNCSLNVVSRKGQKVYSTPEKDWFIFTIQGKYALTGPEVIKQETLNLRSDVQNDFDKWSRQQKVMDVASTFCRATFDLQGSSSILGTAGAGLKVFPPTNAAGTGLSESSKKVDETAEKIYKPFQPACEFLTCNNKYQTLLREKVDGVYNVGPFKDFAKFAEETTGLPTSASFDPYRSYVWAYGSACYPAIVYNNLKLDEIKCEQLRCLEQDVLAGFPISQCSQVYSYMTCKHYVGGINQALPVWNVLQDMTSVFQNVLRNPFSLTLSAAAYFCKEVPANLPVFDVCWLPVQVNKLSAIKSQVDGIISGVGGRKVPGGICSEVLDRDSPVDLSTRFNLFDNVGVGLSCDKDDCTAAVDGKLYKTDSLGNYYELVDDKGQPLTQEEINRRNRVMDESAGVEGDANAGGSAEAKVSVRWKSMNKANAGDETPGCTLSPAQCRQLNLQRFQKIVDEFKDLNAKGIQQEKLNENQRESIASLFDGADTTKIENELENFATASEDVKQEELLLRDAQELLQNVKSGGMLSGDYTIEEAEQAVKVAKNRLKESKKTQERALKNINKEAEHTAAFGTNWAAYSTALRFGVSVGQLSSLFIPGAAHNGWTDQIDRKFEGLNNILHFEDAVCTWKVTGDPVNNLVLSNSRGVTRSGAHIEGQKDGPVTLDNGQKIFDYLITGAVVPKTPRGLHVQIVGKGTIDKPLRDYQVYENRNAEGNLLGYDLATTDYIEVDENNQPSTLTERFGSEVAIDLGRNPIRISGATDEFSAVCLVFLTDPNDFFDRVNIDNNQLCNDLVSS